VNLYDLAEDALADIQQEARETIHAPEKLRHLDTEWWIGRESELSRMFRNLDMAFAELAAFTGKREALGAVLMAVLSIRNRCFDDAVSVLSDPHCRLNFNRKMGGK
jgi:hypothetical protein